MSRAPSGSAITAEISEDVSGELKFGQFDVEGLCAELNVETF
jgi:hypothetical protein